MQTRLVISWILVSLAGAAALTSGEAPPSAWLLATTSLWGALSTAGVRSALLLGGAHKGAARLDDSAAPHRLWLGGALALLLGAVVGGAVGAVSDAVGKPSSWAGWALLLTTTSVLALPLGSVLASRSLAHRRARRSTRLLAWILLDTALPVGALAALAGVVVAAVRYSGVQQVSGVEASRHLAVSVLLYGVLLGIGGGLKTAREKLAGLVEAESPSFEPPGAIATGAAIGLVVLLVGPRVLDDVDTSVLIASKAILGLTVGTGLCALGALRGARR